MTAFFIALLIIVGLYGFYRYRVISGAIRKAHLTQDWTGEFFVGQKSKPLFSILILGDSIAAGVGVEEFEQTLGGRLAKAMSKDFYVKLVNRSQPGIWLSGIAVEEVQGPWDLIVVVAGSNELTHRLSLRFIKSSLDKLLRHLSGQAKFIVLAGPGDVGSARILPFWYRLPLKFRQKDLSIMMAEAAATHKAMYANPLIHPNKEAYFANDGMHPNALGHKAWFDIIWQILEPRVDKKMAHHITSTVATKPEQRLSKKVVNELLFWVHTLFVVGLIVLAFFLPFLWMVLILVAWRIHLYLFDGCFFTRIEEAEGGLPHGISYFQFAAKRFFGVRLSRDGAHTVSVTLTTIVLAVSLIVNFLA